MAFGIRLLKHNIPSRLARLNENKNKEGFTMSIRGALVAGVMVASFWQVAVAQPQMPAAAPIVGTWTWQGTKELCPVTITVTGVNADRSMNGTIVFSGTCHFNRTFGVNQTPPIRTYWDGMHFLVLYLTDGTRFMLTYAGGQLVGKEILVKGRYEHFTWPRADGSLDGTLKGSEIPGDALFVKRS
jgi:hypothetical protein